MLTLSKEQQEKAETAFVFCLVGVLVLDLIGLGGGFFAKGDPFSEAPETLLQWLITLTGVALGTAAFALMFIADGSLLEEFFDFLLLLLYLALGSFIGGFVGKMATHSLSSMLGI